MVWIAPATLSATCVKAPVEEPAWESGDFGVLPISTAISDRLKDALTRRSLLKITSAQARSLAGNANLSRAKHYYLSWASYYGNEGEIDHLPRGVSVRVN